MLPPGFLGTRGDVLMDIVVLSFIVIVPALLFSLRAARRGEWATHKRAQIVLISVLGVAVALFEVDMRLSGGIFELSKGSRFAGTALLNGSIWFHLALSVTTSLVWIGLVVASLRRFPSPPEPNDFSAKHRFWGRLGMVLMGLTGITGVQLYVMGFAM